MTESPASLGFRRYGTLLQVGRGQQSGLPEVGRPFSGGHLHNEGLHNNSHIRKLSFFHLGTIPPHIIYLKVYKSALIGYCTTIMQNELDVLSGMEPQGGMPQPSEAEMQQALASLSPQEKQAAIASLQEIRQIIEQMIAQGATEEEINALLAEVGISMEELEAAEELLAVEPQQLGM